MIRLKRLSGWRIAALILGIFLLIGIGLVLEIRSSADRAWVKLEERTRELIAESNARTTTRAVLRGTPESGRAWDVYDEGLDLFGTLTSPDFTKLIGFAERAPAEDRAAAEKLLSTHGAAIPIIRRGTQRTDTTFHYDWEERTGSLGTVRHVSAQGLVAMMVCEARLVREKGRMLEAARLLLDAVQFSNDLQRRGLALDMMVAVAMLKAPFDELRRIAESRELAAADLAEVDRELAILDRDWPDAETILRNENLYFRCSLIRADEGFGVNFDIASWRYGFSPKLMVTNVVAKYDRHLEVFQQSSRGSWSDLVREAERIKKELQLDRNPLAPFSLLGSVTIQSAHRFRHTQARLLRVAFRHRLDGTVLELDDPFGTKLKNDTAGPKLKFWSVGRDAVDHYGKGTWNDNPTTPNDVVLEMEK